MAPDVLFLLGSKNDLPIAEKGAKVLKEFGIPYEIHVASAHRSPQYLESIVKGKNAKIHIGIAGVAAALPGVLASMVTRPVIGVPVGGPVPYDSLLSIVQMPPGVPVATVGVDRGDNAAFLAAQILAMADPALAQRVADQRKRAAERVMADDKEIQGA